MYTHMQLKVFTHSAGHGAFLCTTAFITQPTVVMVYFVCFTLTCLNLGNQWCEFLFFLWLTHAVYFFISIPACQKCIKSQRETQLGTWPPVSLLSANEASSLSFFHINSSRMQVRLYICSQNFFVAVLTFLLALPWLCLTTNLKLPAKRYQHTPHRKPLIPSIKNPHTLGSLLQLQSLVWNMFSYFLQIVLTHRVSTLCFFNDSLIVAVLMLLKKDRCSQWMDWNNEVRENGADHHIRSYEIYFFWAPCSKKTVIMKVGLLLYKEAPILAAIPAGLLFLTSDRESASWVSI